MKKFRGASRLLSLVGIFILGFVVWLGFIGCKKEAVGQKKDEGVNAKLAAEGKKLYTTKACNACHSVDGTKRVGPTFAGLYGKKVTVITKGKARTVTADEEYLRRSILNPKADLVKGYENIPMPLTPLKEGEVKALIEYIKSLAKGKKGTAKAKTQAQGKLPPLTEEEKKKAAGIFFNLCAGCHGMLRKGATGPALLPENRTRKLGTAAIKNFITYGLPGGMPNWGEAGVLKPDEIDLLARFIQYPPPPPPELPMAQMKKSWKVYVPVAKRPKKPAHKNWQNFFGVVLRDAGKVAIIDGDSKKLLNIVKTGFAVHILRSSGSGRYFYSIGRDGRVTMIDLWMEKPDKVAEVKTCYDARSVDSSKYKGKLGNYMDKLLIVGCYWPPSFVILDGKNLKPLRIFSTSGYTYDTNEYLREARVAAIVSSHHAPEWVVNVKETGYIWLVDYQNVDAVKITAIATERFLHDGGFDASKRYVLMAANARNTVVVVDTVEKKLVARVKVGTKPHPGRGANINHPKYGPIWCTGHLGDNTIVCIGVDPKRHPKYAWKVVATMKMPGVGGGNLFIKTHPKSRWLWADRPLNPDKKLYRSLFVFDKVTFKLKKTLTVPDEFPGRAVHLEYNKHGDEVFVSVWSPKTKKSAILVYDDKNLKLKKVITGDWLITPTGKWNAYNTMKDLY